MRTEGARTDFANKLVVKSREAERTSETWAANGFGPKREGERKFLFIFGKHFRENKII
jgi:hypothetical protein